MRSARFIMIWPAVAVLLGLAVAGCTPAPPASPPTDGSIRGLVFGVFFDQKSGAREVYLPDVEIEVLDLNGAVVDRVMTDLDGGYATKILPPGDYQLCLAKAGFQQNCYTAEVAFYTNHPGPLEIHGAEDLDFLYGTVKLADTEVPFYRQAVFGVDFSTRVRVLGGAPMHSVRCNTAGEFLIPSPPTAGADLEATSQKERLVETVPAGSRVHHMVFANSSPNIRAVTAYDGGAPALRTVPGVEQTLKLVVEDPDGDPLDFIWVPIGDFPGFTSVSAPEVKWQLPSSPGQYLMHVLAMDNRGGVSFRRFSIIAGNREVAFSGTVLDAASGAPIQDATVEVGGDRTATDAQGYFSLFIPEDENRYVLNIRKPGYLLSSHVYFKDETSIDYLLAPATTSKGLDPTAVITVVEERDEFTTFVVADDQNETWERLPAEIEIAPLSIVDENGDPVTGPVDVSLRTVDLYGDYGFMPGDYGAEREEEQLRLESFGAVDVQIRDSADPSRMYGLGNGGTASVKFPIVPPLQPTAPELIELWDYDEAAGVWRPIGQASRDGDFYVATTRQLSALNLDVALNDATCIHLQNNPASPIFPGSAIQLKVEVPVQVGAPRKKTFTVTSLPQVIVRLPPFTAVDIEVRRGGQLLKKFKVNTRDAIPGPANRNPDPPYTYCKDAYLLPPPDPGQKLLARVKNDGAQANKYYELIGAQQLDANGNPINKINFQTWQQQNDFLPAGNYTEDATALYFNAGDLAFWRGMHVRSGSGSNVAFWVSNYTRDVDAIALKNAIATVAMEYSPLPGGTTPRTKFYVFDGAGNLTDKADLDGYGAEFIPGLCVVCHGGGNPAYTTANFNLDTHYTQNPGAVPRFLPFDLQTFEFSNKTGSEKKDMQAPLRTLNEKVLGTNVTQAIQDFVVKAYNDTNVPLNAIDFKNDTVVTGWSSTTADPQRGNISQADFYRSVVAKACRGCHYTRSDNNLWFDTQTKFLDRAFVGAVCGPSKYMPNARVTYDNFWTSASPHGPDQYRKYLQSPSACN